MGGLDFDLDERLDLQLDGAGWFKMNELATAAVVYQTEHELDAWDGDPGAGTRAKVGAAELGATDEGAQFTVVEQARALGVLENADLISNVEVIAEVDPDLIGRLNCQMAWRDNSSGQRIDRAVSPFQQPQSED